MMNPVQYYRHVIKSKDRAIYAEAALALRQWMMAHDPHRPIYHFSGPESWTNDPNGPIVLAAKPGADGEWPARYHLFYQFDPIVAGQRSKRCWGHAVSTDLVHWEDWPIALWPDTRYDRNGVYSGNTFVDDDGHLCALYTGCVRGRDEAYGLLARSTDEGLTWRKTLVMDDSQRPNAQSPVHWDGFLWREGQHWKQLVGGTTGGMAPQGAAWLWTSDDLEQWTLEANIAPTIKRGEYWELPYLLHLDGKDLLMVGQGNPYWFGVYDAARTYFQPHTLTAGSIDNGNYYSFNVNMTDRAGPEGGARRLMHGWVTGPPSPTQEVPYWQGAHSIPRVINRVDDRVWQEPIPEISTLRGPHTRLQNIAHPGPLPVEGDALELLATFGQGSARLVGLKLRVCAAGTEFVRVFYDRRSAEFGVDGPTIARNRRELGAGGGEIKLARQPSYIEPSADPRITLHIFLDRSILEVFVNGCAYTARLFPPQDAQGVEFFAEGGTAELQTLDVWQMRSMWLT